jgi:hypothetical protein
MFIAGFGFITGRIYCFKDLTIIERYRISGDCLAYIFGDSIAAR